MLNVAEWRIEDIKKKLETEIRENTARLEEWNKVTRNKKKDGSDFANIQKNFNGLTVKKEYCVWLEIYTYAETTHVMHYISDSIYVSDNNNLPTVDKMFDLIEHRKKALATQIENDKQDLKNYHDLVMSCLETVNTVLTDFMQQTKGDTIKGEFFDLLSDEIKYIHYR